jgi:3'(2'), 5'-bisphosphate nucleotidase
MELTNQRSYDHELQIALELAREAGAAILDFYEGPLEILQKADAEDSEPVTEADKLANEIIVSRLQREFPADGMLAEESIDTAHRLDKSRVWMIDPLDGTTGFIDGNGDFAVQIGLSENGNCVLGVVYLPLTGVLYRAVAHGGSWIERPDHGPEQMHVSGHREISEMRLAASRSHRSRVWIKWSRPLG